MINFLFLPLDHDNCIRCLYIFIALCVYSNVHMHFIALLLSSLNFYVVVLVRSQRILWGKLLIVLRKITSENILRRTLRIFKIYHLDNLSPSQ